MTQHDPVNSVRDMLQYAADAVGILGGMAFDAIEADRWRTYALVHCIELIGEAAGRIPAEFRVQYPQVPWAQAVGMRNRLIHAYDTIDMEVVWRVVNEQLPPLIVSLRAILLEPR